MSSFYGPDLAAIHDEGYTSFVLKAAPNVLAILKKNGIHFQPLCLFERAWKARLP